MYFKHEFEDGNDWDMRYEVVEIPSFCGAKQLCNFRTGIVTAMEVELLTDRSALEGEKEQMNAKVEEFADAFQKHLFSLGYWRRNMRVVWWERKGTLMYHVGEALQCRAGRKFVNPNSGNTVSQFMLKVGV